MGILQARTGSLLLGRVSWSVWGLEKEGKLWRFVDRERGERHVLYALPLDLVPRGTYATPPGWSA